MSSAIEPPSSRSARRSWAKAQYQQPVSAPTMSTLAGCSRQAWVTGSSPPVVWRLAAHRSAPAQRQVM